MSWCRLCGAEVVWAVTKTRAKVPFDAAPVKWGEYSGLTARLFAFVERPTGTERIAMSFSDFYSALDLWKSGDVAAYISHFKTCPAAGEPCEPRELGTALVPA